MLTATQIAALKNKAIRYGHTNVYDFKARGTKEDVKWIREAIDFIQNHSVGSTLFFPDNKYPISETLEIGANSISATDALLYEHNKTTDNDTPAKSFSLKKHLISAATLPISLKFAARAYLVAAFKSEELKPVLAYGCGGWHHGEEGFQTTTIEGLKIRGADIKVSGKGSNVVGLLMTGADSVTFRDCGFIGLDEGFIHNATYHSKMYGMDFKNCGRGFFTNYSHGIDAAGFKADHCYTGFEIVSGANNWRSMRTEQCPVGLIVGDSANTFQTGYLEQNDNVPASGHQLQIGYEKGHHYYKPLDRISIDNFNLVGNHGQHMIINDGVDSIDVKNTYGDLFYTNPKTKVVKAGQTANITSGPVILTDYSMFNLKSPIL